MKRWRIAALAGLTTLSEVTSARADDRSEIESILSEHVVSTASTTAERASVAPATSTTITSEDIETFGIRSLAEAIDFFAMGVVTSDSLRTPDIGSRGVLFEHDDGKHFLLLVNGHEVNDPLYGAARFDQGAGVPIDLIDHIEVVVGPGSVLYGSNAMMGVINVITKAASDYQGVHVLADTEIGRSYRLAGGGGATFTLFGAPSELTLGVEYYERYGPSITFPQQTLPLASTGLFSNVDWGRGLPPNAWGGTLHNAYFVQAPSGLLRLRSGDFEVNVSANVYRRGVPYSANDVSTQFDDAQSAEIDRALRLDLRHQATLSTLAQLTSRLYADSFDYRRRLDQNAGGSLRSDIQVGQYADFGVARWAGIEERLALNWLHDQSLVTTFGIDARARWVGAKQDLVDASTGAAIAPTTGRFDDTGGIVSPYAQQIYRPLSWLDLNAGVRLDMDSRYSPVLSPRGALAVRPFDKTTVKIIYSQAFRAPTLSETNLTNYLVAPAPDLQPETVRSLEATVEQRFATQRLLFGVFRTWWDGLIEPGVVSQADLSVLQNERKEPYVVGTLIQYRNIASVRNYGWNGTWEGSLIERRLRYGASATLSLIHI